MEDYKELLQSEKISKGGGKTPKQAKIQKKYFRKSKFKTEEKQLLEETLLKYEFALEMLETELDILIKGHVFKTKYNPVEHVKSRIKSQDSAIKKLERKN